MMGWGWHWAGGGWLVMLGSWLIWLALVGLIVWVIVRAVAGPRVPDRSAPPPPRQDDPEEILRSRFARGEIDADEFGQRIEVLRRTRGETPRP